MKYRFRTLLTILLILTLAGLAGHEAYRLLESLFQYRSPLKDIPPAAGDPIGTPLTDKVVLVLMDALREDTALDPRIMPVLDRLRSQGAWASMTSRPPSYSEPGYATILTGAWPDINDGPAFNLEYGDIPAITQVTIFSAAKLSGLKTALSGYYWFEELIPQDTVDLSFYTPGEDRKADRKVLDAALPWLTDESVNLILIHIDQIDYAGHYEGGAKSAAWDEAAHQADQLLEEITVRLDLSRTTLLVFSDHGQIDQGGHGGHDAITLKEPFVAVGKSVIPGAYDAIHMVDIAPTVAVLLGTSLPSSAEGKPLVDMLVLTAEQKQGIASLHNIQQQRLITAYKDVILPELSDRDESFDTDSQSAIASIQIEYLQNGRFVRGVIAVLILGLLVSLGYIKRSTYLFWMLVDAIVFLVVFHLKFSIMDDSPYSFSIISDPLLFILNMAYNTLLSLMVGAIIFGLAIKIFRNLPIRVANLEFIYTILVMLMASLPALYYIVMYGPVIGLVLPDISLLFRCMLSLVQILVIGIGGLVLTGITVAVAGLIHRHQN